MQFIAKVGEIVDITYQATKETTGLTDVTMKILDQTRQPDPTNFPDIILTGLPRPGRYSGSFTPDAKGVWTVTIDSVTKAGPVTYTIIVTDHNLDNLGAAVAALNNLSAAQVEVVVAVVEANIRGTDGDTLKTVSDQLDSLGSPAMVG